MRKLDCATDTIQFRLVPEPYIMDEFTVTDKSNREAYLKLFKTWFLGNNKWGRKAEILNDSVLVFVKNNAKFTTYATAPIQVHLPLLGYDVLVDMNYLTLEESPLFLSMHCFLSASYFFKELPFESERQKRKIDKKRALAYYCSPEHFLRSLYNQQLRENGYQVFYTHIKSEPRHKDQLSVSKQNSDDSFEINKIDPGSDDYTPTTDQIKISYLTDKNGIKYGVLKGYKGDGLEILYRHKRGFPVNLNYANSNVYYKSSLYFNDDVCMFRKNGTMFDTSMLFTGVISSKKIGAILPNGFFLTLKNKKYPYAKILYINKAVGSFYVLDVNATKTVKTFPFELQVKANRHLSIRKTGDTLVYLTGYQKYWEAEPKAKKSDFEIKSNFGSDTFLTAGKETYLVVKIKVKKYANYVMINVPIPDGCSYSENELNNTPYHREHFKNETAIFCNTVTAGNYTFSIGCPVLLANTL